jgi:hypothetical protein
MHAHFCTCFIEETVAGEGLFVDQPSSAICTRSRIRILQQYLPNGDISGAAPNSARDTHWELLDGNSGNVFLSFAHA